MKLSDCLKRVRELLKKHRYLVALNIAANECVEPGERSDDLYRHMHWWLEGFGPCPEDLLDGAIAEAERREDSDD